MTETITDVWPEFLDRHEAARYVTQRYFRVSARTVREWPLTSFRPAKRTVHRREEVDLLARGIVESSQRTRSNAERRGA